MKLNDPARDEVGCEDGHWDEQVHAGKRNGGETPEANGVYESTARVGTGRADHLSPRLADDAHHTHEWPPAERAAAPLRFSCRAGSAPPQRTSAGSAKATMAALDED